jgi:iron complex outermembrane receptor protein
MDSAGDRVLPSLPNMSLRAFSLTPSSVAALASAAFALTNSLVAQAQQNAPPAPPAAPAPPAPAPAQPPANAQPPQPAPPAPAPAPDAPPPQPAPPAGAAPAPAAPAAPAAPGAESAPPSAPAQPAPPAYDAPPAPAPPAENAEAPAESQQLEAVVVEDEALTASDAAEDETNEVSGGANLIRSDELARGTVGTIGDVLDFQPGIYAQSVNGGEATRLSIRGSGIVRSGFLFGWGNVLNLDGQRLYGASGNPYEAVEPLAIDHVQVLRGANAFEYGPLSLGGSINYVTKTGYDSAPFQARFEVGSFGYTHEQVSSGGVHGKFDYYVSLTRFDKDGYRDNTNSYSTRLVANLGYRFSDQASTRFFFRVAEQYQEDAGFLNKAQLDDDPEQSQFGEQVRDRVNPGTIVIGNTTNLGIDEKSNVEIGSQYDSSPIDTVHGGPTQVFFDFLQLAGSVRYKRSDELFGRRSNTLVSFIGHRVLKNRWLSKLVQPETNQALRIAHQSDYTFVAINETELFDHFWLELGGAAIFQHRETSIEAGANPALVGRSFARDFENLVPKAALRYEITPRTQVFANASGAIDTPSSNSYIRTDPLYVPQEFLNLNAAKSVTVEVGTRGQESIVGWNLSAYRSWVEDELLTVQIAPMVTTSSNASPTIHQGVEAGIDLQLWKYARGEEKEPLHQIVLRQSYTWNDFKFEDDDQFGDNRLAGVPIHLYQAELAYENSAGFYVGVNAETSLAEYPADFANTIDNDAYGVLGGRIGYQQPEKGLEVFVQVRNALDETYAPVVAPIFNANGSDSNVYAPGEGRSVNGGVAYRF